MENFRFLPISIKKTQTCLGKEGGNQISMPKAMSDKENMHRQIFGASQTGKTEENLKENDTFKMRSLLVCHLDYFHMIYNELK